MLLNERLPKSKKLYFWKSRNVITKPIENIIAPDKLLIRILLFFIVIYFDGLNALTKSNYQIAFSNN